MDDIQIRPIALTVNEAIQYLRLSRSNLYRMFKRGDIRPVKIGGRTLLRRVDLDAMLDRAAGREGTQCP